MKNCPVRRLIQLKQGYHHGDLRNALVGEALKLLEQEGHSDFTLRDLARRVGVSAAALYAHFADKSALLAAVATTGFVRLRAALEAAVRNDSDSVDQFLHMGSAYVRFGMDHPALYKLMFASEELAAKHGEYPELQAASDGAFDLLTEMLERMQRRGFLRAGDPEADGLSVWAHVHGLTSLIITGCLACVGEPAPQPAEVVSSSLMILLGGLRSPGRAERIA
ncbi:MAG TPA: TetR/AcrR family transcriptional regulator [Steroidobacteraceae bacterium]|nr:TetR/AcrR family transcriptional regulator [Steroidobacteraceae bacterium]